MTAWSDKIARELEQLTGYSTSGRVLTSNGGTTPPTWQAPSGGVTGASVLGRATPLTRIASTTTPTSAFGGAITVPAGTLSTNGQALWVRMHGNNLNNSGAGRTFTLNVSLNGVTLVEDGTAAYSSGATRRPWWIEIQITRVDATHCTASFVYQFGASAAATTGLGDYAAAAANADLLANSADGGVAGVAFGSGQSLDVLITPSFSAATVEWCTDGGIVMVM